MTYIRKENTKLLDALPIYVRDLLTVKMFLITTAPAKTFTLRRKKLIHSHYGYDVAIHYGVKFSILFSYKFGVPLLLFRNVLFIKYNKTNEELKKALEPSKSLHLNELINIRSSFKINLMN